MGRKRGDRVKREKVIEVILIILIIAFGFAFGYSVNYRIYKVEQKIDQLEADLKQEIEKSQKRIKIDTKQRDILKVEPTDGEIVITIGGTNE